MGYLGNLYPLGINQTAINWKPTEEIAATLPNYMQAISKSPPAFAAQLVRATTLSQARLIFRNRVDRHTFRTPDLEILEKPWPNGTTGELLNRMEWSEGLSGQAYVYRQPANRSDTTVQARLRVLRPDWVAIVYGSASEPDDPKGALDSHVVGYMYVNGGFARKNNNRPVALLPEEIAHWTPLPDPMSPGLGMSWLTPGLRELQSDKAAEEFKLAFFTNGATPNLVVKAGAPATRAQFDEWVDDMEKRHAGSLNAFKTLYLQMGADATVVGSNLQQLQLTDITSHSETRISYLSRVPAVILGIAAGLKGSSLNAGNYGEARRNFADSWYYSTLQDACAALETVVNVPGGGQLWYDVADVPLLREDAKDAADIVQVQMSTIVSGVNGGFEPDTVIQAVLAQDLSLLKHTGLVSVQLQPPGVQEPDPDQDNDYAAVPPPSSNGSAPAKKPAAAAEGAAANGRQP